MLGNGLPKSPSTQGLHESGQGHNPAHLADHTTHSAASDVVHSVPSNGLYKCKSQDLGEEPHGLGGGPVAGGVWVSA